MPLFSSVTHSTVTVGNSSTSVLTADEDRAYCLLQNDSDETIYLKFGAAGELNKGIRLNANGGQYEISGANNNLYTGAINAICTSGSKKLLVTVG